jgi:dTDP-4-amino-4,6-dideoxygalactose transaminase
MSDTKQEQRFLHLSRSIVGEAEAAAVSRVLIQSGYLGMGEEVRLFEQDIATYLGVPPEWVVAVNTGTAALHLAMEAVLTPGSEVLIPSLTYVASFQAALGADCVPVPCDIDPATGLLDLVDATTRVTAATRAVMPVHYAGNPALLNTIYEFANKHNLRVIEDAAHAFGSIHAGRKVGSSGDMVCFSFDGIKNITCGEGGAVITADEIAARRVRDARLLAVENDTEKRYAGSRSWNFDVSRRGFRYHMSNLMAAIGRVQLTRLEPEFIPARRQMVRIYHERLKNTPGLVLLEMDISTVVAHIYPIRVLNGRRGELITHLQKRDIPTGIHYKPNHLLTLFGSGHASIPQAEALGNELTTLPLHPGLCDDDVHYICDAVVAALR